MFLEHLTIENLRSIAQLDLSFQSPTTKVRKWTLLLGENGTGKSSVLRAIALLLAGRDALPDLLGDPAAWIRARAPLARISGTLVTKAGQRRHIALELRRGATIAEVIAHNAENLTKLQDALNHSPDNYPVFAYGASRRLSPKTAVTFTEHSGFRSRRSQAVATLFSADAVLNPLETWAFDLHYKKGNAGLQLIKDSLNRLLPNVAFKRVDKQRLQLIFATPDGDVPLAQLSDGYQNMAAWCGDLLYRLTTSFGRFRDPLSARGLILLDEIDLHLHPAWQRDLVGFLDDRLPNFQIVATTHSPLTAQQTGDGELFFLRRPTPISPPELESFQGAARDLYVHQLLLSPAFGLTTMRSRELEDARTDYLAKKSSASPAKAARTPAAARLKNAPAWDAGSGSRERVQTLLDQMRAELKGTAPSA